ncbi:hypothetical protein C2S51_020145 [Perilla frutescens var. frutescens]|nr:hypothetical protein C2S51_020145 [Perilla frutescens var. frutescens]
MVDHFLLEVKRRLHRAHRSDVVICSPYLFLALQAAWKGLHPKDPECRDEYGPDRYLEWEPLEALRDVVKGQGGIYEIPWARAQYAIMICNVGGSHWVTVRICFETWKVELYDSLLFQMDDPENKELSLKRDRQLIPLLRLLPRLLSVSGFWGGRSRPVIACYAMTLDKSIQEQFLQFDSTSCGVYAMMYVDRLLFGSPSLDISQNDIQDTVRM